ncbi:hypothetical protein M8C21_032306 [Ambrosia artemisiifolia]|uniref:DUF1677 family protein n=1 Tax=Ambrosia artemisiifolia TaxID=4212 RepID=A0AAD5GKD8_AMBAR|nr:hypothetical protein M8C21_032306 [Ambrosia artemisiifolia]
MSTSVMSDAMLIPATESSPVMANIISEAMEVEFVKCECCGLTEECTPQYIERIRERYVGRWICGLCGEAVKDEIIRSKRLISTEEAMARHMSFCKASISSSPLPDSTVRVIATVRHILRRSLVKSQPSSPTTMSFDSLDS